LNFFLSHLPLSHVCPVGFGVWKIDVLAEHYKRTFFTQTSGRKSFFPFSRRWLSRTTYILRIPRSTSPRSFLLPTNNNNNRNPLTSRSYTHVRLPPTIITGYIPTYPRNDLCRLQADSSCYILCGDYALTLSLKYWLTDGWWTRYRRGLPINFAGAILAKFT